MTTRAPERPTRVEWDEYRPGRNPDQQGAGANNLSFSKDCNSTRRRAMHCHGRTRIATDSAQTPPGAPLAAARVPRHVIHGRLRRLSPGAGAGRGLTHNGCEQSDDLQRSAWAGQHAMVSSRDKHCLCASQLFWRRGSRACPAQCATELARRRGLQGHRAWSSPRWTPATYRFLQNAHVPGPCMRTYSVVNDRTHAPSTGCVQNKHQLEGAGR